MARRPRSSEVVEGDAIATLPTVIRLTAPHGFIEGVHNKGVFHWEAGEIVDNPATVALLIKRGASWEAVQ